MAWPTVELTLLATRSAWLATTRPDGRPHVTPMWFVWEDGVVHFATDPASQKGVNISRRGDSVLSVGDGDDVIIAEGVARLVTDADEIRRIDRRYREKYVEPVTGERATIAMCGSGLYRLEVDRIMAWIYGKAAARTDWRWDARAGTS